MDIRPATRGDAERIRRVHLNAFETGLEADLVERLGRDADAVISLIAVEDGAIVGHILLSRMSIDANGPASGRASYAAAFAELE